MLAGGMRAVHATCKLILVFHGLPCRMMHHHVICILSWDKLAAQD